MVKSDLPITIKIDLESLGYTNFIQTHQKSIIKDERLFCFLIFWLLKYLLYTSSQRVILEYAPIAKALMEGRGLALALFVLSHLYKICFDLCFDHFNSNQGGTIWVLQLWLSAYFLDINPYQRPNHSIIYELYLSYTPPLRKELHRLIVFLLHLSRGKGLRSLSTLHSTAQSQ